jgi:hypothetical protein
MIRINQGKGGRDREVPLSPKLLETLRVYFRWMRPTTFLFPGTVKAVRADVPISPNTVWLACQQAAQRAGITKRLSPHSLRHYVPCLTMSCNGEPLRILPGEIRSPPAKPADMTRHSFLLAADSSGKRGVSPQVYSDPVVHAARMFSPKLSPSWQSSLPDEFVGFQLVRDQPQGA